MTKFFSCALLLAATALAGCETTIDLPEPPHTPKVALFHLLSTTPQDSSFYGLFQDRQLYVSGSQRVFDSREILGRADATVELRDAGGAVVERYRPLLPRRGSFQDFPGQYRPVLNFQPQPGQRYTLRAAVPGLETVESTLTMPLPAVVESGTYVRRTPGPNDSPNMFRGRLSVVVQDDPAAANYYMAYARVLDQQGRPGNWSAVNVDFESQSSNVSINQFQLSSPQQDYSQYPFADTDVNGQRISLASDVLFYGPGLCMGGTCPPPAFIEVHVSSITRDAYNFYLSRRRYFDSDGNPFAEPAPLASNIRGGYGLFGGTTDVVYRIRIM
jgi:hypothetical protein